MARPWCRLDCVVLLFRRSSSLWQWPRAPGGSPRRWSGGHGRSRASRGRQVLQTNRSIIDGSGCNSLSGASWLKPSTILTHDGYSCEEGENMFLLTWLDRLKLTYKNSQEYFARTRQSKHCGLSIYIFLIIQSQNQWSGWSGQRRWSGLVWSLLER